MKLSHILEGEGTDQWIPQSTKNTREKELNNRQQLSTSTASLEALERKNLTAKCR